MKKILVIGSAKTDEVEKQSLQNMVAFIQGSLKDKDQFSVFGCHLDEISYVTSNNGVEICDLRNERELAEYDLVYFRGKLRAYINDVALISSYLDAKGITFLTSAYKNRRATGKVPQMFQLQLLGFPIPYSVSASAGYLPELIDEHLTYPVILKDMHGGHGNDNYLVKNKDELQSILKDRTVVRFIAQEFIPNDGDYRVLIIGEETAIIHRKGSDDSHLNNTSQGGTATLVGVSEFPKEIVEQARIYAAECQYEIAGVDAIIDKNTGKHYFLEINSQPQLMTGAFVEKKQEMIGKYFKQLLDQ